MFGLEGLRYRIPARDNVETYRRGTILPNLGSSADKLSGFVYIQDKADGVEPGFLALKYHEPFFKQVKVSILNVLNRVSNHHNDVATVKLQKLFCDLIREKQQQIKDDLLKLFAGTKQDTDNSKILKQSLIQVCTIQNKQISIEELLQELMQHIADCSDQVIASIIFALPEKLLADLFMAVPDIADYLTGEILIACKPTADSKDNLTAIATTSNASAHSSLDERLDIADETAHASNNYKELSTKYFIKQDYNDPSRGDDKVTIPHYRAANTNQAKGFGILRGIYAFFYRLKRRRTRDEENLNAIREVLATEVARQWGAKTHNQGLSLGTYQDRHPKLITISEWNDNAAPLTNALKTTTITGGSYRYGNYLATMDPKTGRYVSDKSIADLGEHLTLFIALADPDGIGSNGNNKLKIPRPNAEDQFDLFYIDMGQCLRGKNPLAKKLEDDFSIELPYLSPFKNLSIFYDTPLSERMKGIHILNKLRRGIDPPDDILDEYDAGFRKKLQQIEEDADAYVFDDYINKFKELAKSNPAHRVKYTRYADEIETARRHYLDATQTILTVFKKRLSLSPAELNLLDKIEKLTSKRSIYSPDGKVRLKHLRVESGTRVAWQLIRPADVKSNRRSLYSLTTTADTLEQALAIKTCIQNYLQFVDQGPDKMKIVIDNSNQVILRFTALGLKCLQQIFNESHMTLFTQLEHAVSQNPALNMNEVCAKNNIYQHQLKQYERAIERFAQAKVTPYSSREQIEADSFQLSKSLLDIHTKALNKDLVEGRVEALLERIRTIKEQKIEELAQFEKEVIRHEEAQQELQQLVNLIDNCCIFSDQAFPKAMHRLEAIEAKIKAFADKHDITVTEGGNYVTANNPYTKPLVDTLKDIYQGLNERRNQVLSHHLPIGLLNFMVNKSGDPLFMQWERAYLHKNPLLKEFKLQLNKALMVSNQNLSRLKDYKEVLLAANNKDIKPFKTFLKDNKSVVNIFYCYRIELNKASDNFTAYQKPLANKPKAVRPSSSIWYKNFGLFKAKPVITPAAKNTGLLATLWNALRI